MIPYPKNPIEVGSAQQVRQFRFYARNSGRLRIQLWRQMTKTGYYELLSSTEEFLAKGQGVYNVTPTSPLYVQDGDLLGFYTPGSGVIPFDEAPCQGKRTLYLWNPTVQQLSPGAESRFLENQVYSCTIYSLQLIAEMPSRISGVTHARWVRAGKDRLVNREDSRLVTATSLRVCAATCQRTTWCESFVFSPSNRNCWMNVKVLNPYENDYLAEKGASYYEPVE